MRLFSRWRIHKNMSEEGSVDISEQGGVRSLHLGNDTVQSSMRVARPNDLELAYTRSMMAFLLFKQPKHILMIGLGGGSLAKFVYHRMPHARVTVVEISAKVVAAARSHFCLPEDDERLQLVIDDAAEFVASTTEVFDAVMVDGFNEHCQVESLATESFYSHCQRLLCPDGVLVVNLWGSDTNYSNYFERITAVFGGQVLALPAEKRGNVIVFGFEKPLGMPRWSDLRERGKELEALYGLEFLEFIESFKRMNLYSEKRLLI